MPDPVLDAILQRRAEIVMELREYGHYYDNLDNMTILLKTNAFLFKKTISKILDKTHGGSVYKWRANKIYRYMYGLAKNLEVAKKELEDSDWSPAVALDVEKDIREARKNGGKHFFRLSLTLSDYLDDGFLPFDELKDEMKLFSSLRAEFYQVTSAYAVAILKKAGLSAMYGPVIDDMMMFYTEDPFLVQYLVEQFADDFADYL